MQHKKSKRRKLSKEERELIYAKTAGHCAYCGCELDYKEMQVDHLKSLHGENGEDTLENMMPACRSCNHYKSSMTLEKFRASLERMPNVLLRDSVTFRIAQRYKLVTSNSQQVVFYFEQKV